MPGAHPVIIVTADVFLLIIYATKRTLAVTVYSFLEAVQLPKAFLLIGITSSSSTCTDSGAVCSSVNSSVSHKPQLHKGAFKWLAACSTPAI